MKSRWIIAGASALALGILTLPLVRGGGTERIGGGSPASPARAQTCNASGDGKLDFVLKDMNDKPLNLASYKGKVVVLNFWATWCGPCKQEIPAFVELYDQYKDKGFVIVGVSIDDSPEQLRAFTREWRMQYPIAQMQSDIESSYGPFFGIPTTFFIARDGSICTKHLGPSTKEQFEREIKALL
jgi:cytochrome c biogenesis protein CcmG/thiol:disulfide interchange protein DsbE